jgi:hypothetical protein
VHWIALWVVVAEAAEPTRCVATWTPPVPGCALRQPVSALAAGRSEAAARRAVMRQLEENLGALAAALAAEVPGLPAESLEACPATAADGLVACFVDRELAEERICVVGLRDEACWTGDYLNVRARGWEAIEQGREAMCSAVAQRIATLGYAEAGKRQAICQASCQVKTTVVCPGGTGATGK